MREIACSGINYYIVISLPVLPSVRPRSVHDQNRDHIAQANL